MRQRTTDPRDGKITRLGHAVNDYLALTGRLERSVSSLVAEIWPQVVGPWYARGSYVIRLRAKELAVCCATPALAQQLHQDQIEIIARLNERLGGKYLSTIRASSVGPAERKRLVLPTIAPTVTFTDEELARIKLTAEEQEFCAQSAADISDPELRSRAEELIGKALRVDRWKLEHGYRPCQSCGRLHHEPGADCFVCELGRRKPPTQGTDEPWPDFPSSSWKS